MLVHESVPFWWENVIAIIIQKVEFDRPGERSPEYKDCCCWQWLMFQQPVHSIIMVNSKIVVVAEFLSFCDRERA